MEKGLMEDGDQMCTRILTTKSLAKKGGQGHMNVRCGVCRLDLLSVGRVFAIVNIF